MARSRSGRFGRRHPAWAQAAVVAWVIGWFAVGVVAAVEIRNLLTFSDTLEESAVALDTAGSGLETIGALPIIGDGPERLGGEVRSTAVEVRRSAAESRDSIRTLSAVLGLSIAIMPTAPVVGFYLHLQNPAAREAAVIRQALGSPGVEPALEQYLARRAVHNLPYDELMQVSDDPWADLADRRFERLADAELRRLGLRRVRGAG